MSLLEPSGEEGTLFQGDIRLTHYDDPYDLYRTVFNRMIFDVEGSGETSPLFDDTITSRLWPDATVPYRFASHLSECVCADRLAHCIERELAAYI